MGPRVVLPEARVSLRAAVRRPDHLGQTDAGGAWRLDVDLIDVREVALPTYALPTPPAVAHRQYANDAERLLGERFDAADGYLIAPLKNVLDQYVDEFEHKPVAFVGYGNVGGSRALEQLRQVIVELTNHDRPPAQTLAGTRGRGSIRRVTASLSVMTTGSSATLRGSTR